MNVNVRRGQTTKGVWMACDSKNKVLVIDCEGTDSKSRSEQDRGKFEHSSSLFALAMSDILIINMWTSDVGRYTASNYGVLKIMFEMNLKLFEQKTAKKIIIFLRDFDSTRNLKNKIEELILEDIKKIWSEIKIPEKYVGKGPENFFSFEFITLPHKVYREKEFDNEILKLRERLNKNNPNYFFSNLSSIKNVPADGLKQYITQIWTDILNDKDLDIPSQREMLANYRCTEIKNKILLNHENEFKELNKLSSEKDLEDFKQRCLDLKEKICNEYEKQGSNYDNKIYLNIYKQLEENISQKLYVSFINQTKRIIPLLQKWMRRDLQKSALKLDKDNENYLNITEKLSNHYLKLLVTKLQAKKAFDSWKITEKEYSNIFDEIIEEQKKKVLTKLKNDTIEKLKIHSEELFLSSIENYSNDKNFWKDFNEKYVIALAVKIFPLRIYLRDCYNCDPNDVNYIIQNIQDKVYNDTKKNINKKMRDISQLIVDQFKKKFWYEENSDSQMRNWNKLEELEIDILFKKLREEYLSVFEEFKYFELIKDIMTMLDFKQKEILEEDVCLNLVNENLKNKTDFESLLKQGDILAIKRKFETGISQILEDAKRRRQGFELNMPYWFYGLLIFFGYDDVFRLIRSKYIVPILLLVGAYFVLVQFKYDWIIRDSYYFVEEKLYKTRVSIEKLAKEKTREIKRKYNITL